MKILKHTNEKKTEKSERPINERKLESCGNG